MQSDKELVDDIERVFNEMLVHVPERYIEEHQLFDRIDDLTKTLNERLFPQAVDKSVENDPFTCHCSICERYRANYTS